MTDGWVMLNLKRVSVCQGVGSSRLMDLFEGIAGKEQNFFDFSSKLPQLSTIFLNSALRRCNL